MAVVVRLLGRVEALVDGNHADLGPPQQRTLLALLALRQGTPVRAAAIEEALWDGAPPPSAAKIVQTYVSRLRKILGSEAIESSAHGYLLSPTVDVDVWAFRRLSDQHRFAEALALWRGPALADVPVLAADARQLDAARVSVVEDRIDGELEAGGGPALVAELAALSAEHPTRERLLGQLVIALYRSGRQVDALAAYRSGREALVENLGLEPGPALRELELRILRHDPTLLFVSAGPALRRPRRRRVLVALVAAALAAAAATTATGVFAGRHGPKVVPIRANMLLQLDPRTNRFVAAIPIARSVTALEATPHALWLASERERTVSRLDLRTKRLTTIGEPRPVTFLAHDDRGNIYASGFDFPFVWQIDPDTVQIVRSFRVRTRAVGLAAGGGSLWVVDRFANAVTRIDLAEERVAETIKTGVNPLGATFGYGALWVANGDSGTIAVLRPGAQVPILVRNIPSPFGISAGAGAIWVASNGTHAVYRIDPDTHAILARIDLGTPSDFLYTVSASPYGVWAIEDHHLVRIDAATDRVLARIRFPRGTEPKAVAAADGSVWITVGNPKDDA